MSRLPALQAPEPPRRATRAWSRKGFTNEARTVAPSPWAAPAAAAIGIWLTCTPCVDALQQQQQQQQQQAAGAAASVEPCRARTSCVSTASFMQPSQYLPPWSYQPSTPDAAFRSLLHELQDRDAIVTAADAAAGRISARVPVAGGGGGDGRAGAWPFAPQPAGGGDDADDMTFVVRPDGVVLFRSQALRQRPEPPFCAVRGCISGPATRARLEALRNSLGWGTLETDEDKAWVQILLH